jgi:DNA-binding transcriptional MerR regulator
MAQAPVDTPDRMPDEMPDSPADATSDRSLRSVRPPESDRAATAVRDWFRAGDVTEIVRVSRRQLQYWAQTDLIRPSARTPGGHGRYTFRDLVALKAAKRLIDAGVPVQRIRKSIRALAGMLPTVRKPLNELVLVATGDVVLAFRNGMAFDAISGQEWVFEVAELHREVERWRSASAAQVAPPRAAPGVPPSRLESRC